MEEQTQKRGCRVKNLFLSLSVFSPLLPLHFSRRRRQTNGRRRKTYPLLPPELGSGRKKGEVFLLKGVVSSGEGKLMTTVGEKKVEHIFLCVFPPSSSVLFDFLASKRKKTSRRSFYSLLPKKRTERKQRGELAFLPINKSGRGKGGLFAGIWKFFFSLGEGDAREEKKKVSLSLFRSRPQFHHPRSS